MGDRNRLFISYSHEDTRWLGAITEQLAVLQAEGLVSICDDPLLVEPCPWQHVDWLAKLQLRPQDAQRRAKPLASFTSAARKQKLADIASEIATLVKQ